MGATCSYPIEGEGSVILVAANTAITAQIINGLRDRGIFDIDVDPRDLASLRGIQKKKPNAKQKATGKPGQWQQSVPVKEMLVDRFEEGLSEERAQKIAKSFTNAKDRFQKIQQSLQGSGIDPKEALQEVSDGFARSMVEDQDQTVGMLATEIDNDIDERSVRMAALGMAVAIELGLDGPQTLEVGTVGLLHDIGLHAMDPRFSSATNELNEADAWEYKKHPLLSVQCVRSMMDIPDSIELAIQQVHEQADGSGFPRGLKGNRIHLHARILNVVDAYLKLTASPPGHIALVPHDAMGLLLHRASHGLFDPKVIKAFLAIETLFPLGSMVELSTGDVAQVIRRPRNGFALPVLQGSDGDRIELESADVQVMRPVCDPKRSQSRLSKDLMQTSEWHPSSGSLVLA
ncbi:MAG: HD-GYP domain-containing protein [Rubripirellula sp.]